MVKATKSENVSDLITKMWSFINELNDSQEYTKFATLITSLVVITTSLRKSFNNKQLFTILTTILSLIKKVLPFQVILKLKILTFLSKISTQFFKNIDRTENVITVISNIFYSLLKDEDVVVRYLTILEMFCLRDTAQHEELFNDSVKSDKLLINQIEMLFGKEKSIKIPEIEVEKFLIKIVRFKHICGPKITLIEENGFKRIKLDSSDDLIEKILNQVNSLRDKQKYLRLTEANLSRVRSIVDILKEIQ